MREGRAYFLSEEFFADYPHERFPEIEQKGTRPHVVYLIKLEEDVWFAIPLRSHLGHPFGFRTVGGGGLDYSKAIPVLDERYVDGTRAVHIRDEEYPVIRKNARKIKDGMARYVRRYVKARSKMHIRANRSLVEKSVLQYFEEELGIAHWE